MTAQPALPNSNEQLAAENALLRTLLQLTVQYAFDTGTAIVAFSAEVRQLAIQPGADLGPMTALLNGQAATATLYTARSVPLLESLGLAETLARAPSNRLLL
jgi:hypothetical protein